MKRSKLFFLLWISLTQPLAAQTATETLEFARQQVQNGQYQSALKAYQRVLFFARNQYGTECYAQLAELHARLGDMQRSANYYDLLYQSARNDSIAYAALFGKTGLLILQKEYKKALLELLTLPDDLGEPWQSRRYLYEGAAHFGARQFSEARNALFLLVPYGDPRRPELERWFEKAEKTARKNPKTARNLSIVLPGAGQLYAGDVKNGVNSLLLNSGLALWFVAMWDAYSFTDAGFTVIPWLFRYYAGGFQRAGRILEQRKEEKLKQYFRSMLDVIQQKQ
jgi:hypothetical protein